MQKFRLKYYSRFYEDLEDIREFYFANQGTYYYVDLIVTRILNKTEELKFFPLAYAKYEKINDPNIRVCHHKKFIIFFHVDKTERIVTVLRVFYSARDINTILGNKI